MATVAEGDDIPDAQPFLGNRSNEEKTVGSRDSANDKSTLTPLSASSIDLAHSAPRVKDNAWATAFKVNIGLTFLVALYFGGPVLKLIKLATLGRSGQLNLEYEESKNYYRWFRLKVLFILVVALRVMVAIVMARSWTLLRMIIRCPKFIIKASYLILAVIFFVVAALSGYVAWVWATITAGTLGTLCVYLFFRRQSGVRFAAANLKVAAVAVDSMPWTIYTALFMHGINIVWIFITIVAAAGSTHAFQSVVGSDGTYYPTAACNNVRFENAIGNVNVVNAIGNANVVNTIFDINAGNVTIDADVEKVLVNVNSGNSIGDGNVGNAKRTSCECNGEVVSSDSACQYTEANPFLILFWTISGIWSNLVISNVVTATIAGSVASWWFSPNDTAPVRGAFYRATHASFGSLCKAAAISCLVRAFHAVLRHLLLVAWCLGFLLSRVQDTVDYVLQYSICFISVYGLSFSEASSRTRKLLQKHSGTALGNDAVVSMSIFVTGGFAMFAYMGAAFLLKWLWASSSVVETMKCWGMSGPLVISLSVYMTLVFAVLQVVRSSCTAVFACFVQDPSAPAASHHHELHSELSEAWQELNGLKNTEGRAANTAPQNVQYEKV